VRLAQRCCPRAVLWHTRGRRSSKHRAVLFGRKGGVETRQNASNARMIHHRGQSRQTFLTEVQRSEGKDVEESTTVTISLALGEIPCRSSVSGFCCPRS
jgi:hypothetical protein